MKKIKCNICDCKFTRKDNLARHVKNKHNTNNASESDSNLTVPYKKQKLQNESACSTSSYASVNPALVMDQPCTSKKLTEYEMQQKISEMEK